MRIILVWIAFTPMVFASQTVVVIVDDSGSMESRMTSNRGVRRIDAAKYALNVVLSRLPGDTEIGILALNGDWIVPLQPVDLERDRERINRLEAGGGTPLGTFMKIGMDELLRRRAEKIYGDYRLLVVTDGEANDQDVLDAVLPDIMSRGITVDVIGVDMQSAHSLATQVHTYRRADDPASLESAIAAALAESDDDDISGADSDFELLKEFPLDIAPVVLSTLAEAKNAPISASADRGGTIPGRSVFVPAPAGGSTGAGPAGILGALFCMGFVIFVVAVLTILMRVARRV